MKRFLFEIFGFLVLFFITLNSIYFFAGAYIDPYYKHFTSSKQSSLILGTSRANIGIMPKILNQNLDRTDIYNFAFNGGESPWGEDYYNIIQKKINKKSHNGIFIFGIDPTSICSKKDKNGNENLSTGTMLKKITHVNQNPNFDYMFNIINNPLYHIFTSKLHDDGFLELYAPYDSLGELNNRRVMKEVFFRSHAKNELSEYRLNYLKKTIELCKNQGEVYLIRLPIATYLTELENSHFHYFDSVINVLSQQYNIPYFNYKNDSELYKYTIDGNHFVTESAVKFSKELSDSIKNNQPNKFSIFN